MLFIPLHHFAFLAKIKYTWVDKFKMINVDEKKSRTNNVDPKYRQGKQIFV